MNAAIDTSKTVAYDITPAITYNKKAEGMLNAAQGFVIDSEELLELAGLDLRAVKALQKEVEGSRTTITVPLNAALKAVNDLFRAPATYLEQAENVLKKGIGAYQLEQSKIAAAARLKADQEAAAQRKILEDQAQASRDAAALAAADGDTQAQELFQAEADTAEILGSIVTVAPTVTAPKAVSGLSTRKIYSVESVDLLTLVKAVAEGRAPLECIQTNASFIGAQARAFKRKGELFPGVMVEEIATLSARA